MEPGYSLAHILPPAYTPDYDFFLFNHPDHLRLQADHWLDFFLLKKVYQKSMAQISFHVERDVARSPFRAPFGSFLFSDKLSPLDLYGFVRACEETLQQRGVRKIILTEPPLFYRKSGELLHTILLNQGYRVSNAELSSGIKVENHNFENTIEAWEKRKLKQCKSKGLHYKHLPPGDIEKVYEFILKCRKQKDYTLSMTMEELTNTARIFKDSFILFGVLLDNELVAAAITIRVHPLILFNFYSAHLKKYDSLSPVVLMISGIHRFCIAHHIRLLDLGTSALNGQPNFSLLDFKLRLGAIPSMKLTFEKELT